MSNIDNTLNERGSRYGAFTVHATITQGLKREMQAAPKWYSLPDDMKEALEMVAHKIGRILNGDPNYVDSWHDIIGYTRLVEIRLESEAEKGALETVATQINAVTARATPVIGHAQTAGWPGREGEAGIREQA